LKPGLSTREVADIVGVPESRIRYWAQIGLVGPTYRPEGGRPAYAFSDLVAARATRELIERGVPARRVREAISALRAQLPTLDRPLLHLRVLSDGERLVVAGDQPYEPLTGQRVMEFPLDELSRKVAELSPVPRAITPDMTIPNHGASEGSGRVEAPSTALAWFERGLTAAMTGRHDEAMDAYRAALALDATLAPAHANLGALLAHAGERTEAARHLDAALALDPSAVEARMSRASLHELADEPEHALSLWAALVADAPARPPVRAGYTRTSALVRRRHAL
jgi:DNA-binding transcriptional MerR regulator